MTRKRLIAATAYSNDTLSIHVFVQSREEKIPDLSVDLKLSKA